MSPLGATPTEAGVWVGGGRLGARPPVDGDCRVPPARLTPQTEQSELGWVPGAQGI